MFFLELALAERLLTQQKQDKNELYSRAQYIALISHSDLHSLPKSESALALMQEIGRAFTE